MSAGLGNKVRFNANHYGIGDVTVSYTSGHFTDHYGKSAGMNGVTPSGFVSTPWYRGVQRVTSLQGGNFYTKANLTREWYRQWVCPTCHRMITPRTSFPGWDKSLRTYHAPNHLVESSKVKVMEQVAQRKFDLSESLAGAVATYRMLDRATGTLAIALLNLRKGNFAHAARVLGRPLKKRLKDPASAWVELSYGWRPLVNDIAAGIELLKAQIHAASLETMHASATSTEVLKGAGEAFILPQPQFNIVPLRVLSEDNKVSARTEVYFSVDPNVSNLWTSVTFDNPLYLGWVALPWSFAIDWLIPVGDWLLSATANTGFVYRGGHTTHRLQIQSEVEGTTFSFINDYWLSSKHNQMLPRCRNEVMVISRTVNYSWPKPSLYVNTSPFRSSTRTANALALLAIQVKRR
jgi:hypothetical protein